MVAAHAAAADTAEREFGTEQVQREVVAADSAAAGAIGETLEPFVAAAAPVHRQRGLAAMRLMASTGWWYGYTVSTGPNTSSSSIFMPALTPVRIVGAILAAPGVG